jgi:hypothetical protein
MTEETRQRLKQLDDTRIGFYLALIEALTPEELAATLDGSSADPIFEYVNKKIN